MLKIDFFLIKNISLPGVLHTGEFRIIRIRISPRIRKIVQNRVRMLIRAQMCLIMINEKNWVQKSRVTLPLTQVLGGYYLLTLCHLLYYFSNCCAKNYKVSLFRFNFKWTLMNMVLAQLSWQNTLGRWENEHDTSWKNKVFPPFLGPKIIVSDFIYRKFVKHLLYAHTK